MDKDLQNNNDQILDSWKEISQYLDKTEKTCRHWHQALGLPIHRMGDSPKARVFAYKSELDSWRRTLSDEECPEPPDPTAVIRSIPKILLILFFFIVTGISTYFLFFYPSKSELADNQTESLAVVYFENRTQDKDLDYLKIVIPDLLITSLEQSKSFDVMTWERMRDILKQMGRENVECIDTDLGFELCRREGVKTLVAGSFIKLGNTLATDVKMINVDTKKLIKTASSKGNGEQSLLDFQIDQLSSEISLATGFSKTGTGEITKPVREVTTPHIKAYKYYIQGREEIGSNTQMAVKYLNKAIEIDPNFALAYSELGFSYYLLGIDKEAIVAIRKAKELSRRVNEKERLWIEFYHNVLERDNYDKRLTIVNKITREYPKDKFGHFWLGAFYKVQGMFEEGKKATSRALELDPNWIMGLYGLVWIYYNNGYFEEAIETTNRIVKVNPLNPRHSTFGTIFFAMGKLNKAIEEYEKYSIPKSHRGQVQIAYIEALRENYPETLKRVDKYINTVPNQHGKAYGYFWKGLYEFWLGRFQQAISDLDQAKQISIKIVEKVEVANLQGLIDLLRGWIYYDRGELKKARICIRNWYNIYIKLPYCDDSVYNDHEINALYQSFQVFLDLKSDRINSMKSRLNEIKSDIHKIRLVFIKQQIKRWYHLLMAEVLLKEGKAESAIDQCKNFGPAQIPNIQQIFYPQIYNLPYIHDTLARAYVQNGDLDNAISEYLQLTSFNPVNKDRRLIHPLYHYRLAKLYQRKGLKQKAIKSYNKFIDLWKNCDPQCQHLIKDVGARVKALAGIQ